MTPTPPPDDWIPWTGGECPVPPKTLVETKWRNGVATRPAYADTQLWLWGVREDRHDGVRFYRLAQSQNSTAMTNEATPSPGTPKTPEKKKDNSSALADSTGVIQHDRTTRAEARNPQHSPAAASETPETFEAVRAAHLAWCETTFPGETVREMYIHLTEEIDELSADLSDSEEIADCLLLMCSIANASGIDLVSAMKAKLEINKARKWKGNRHVE